MREANYTKTSKYLLSACSRFSSLSRARARFLLLPIIVIALYGCWYTVNQGDRALVLRFGKVIEVTEPGLHFKLPIIDSPVRVSVRTRKMQNKQAVYSKDVQGAEVVFSLNYSLNPASVADIYAKFGLQYEDRVILPQILDKVKNVFGQYAAVDIVRYREKLTLEILASLQERFTAAGVLIETVQIENIDFSDEYERSVEERMRAEVEVAKITQNREREKIQAEMVIIKAQAARQATIAQAQGDAEQIRLKGEAEAAAITAKADALARNPVMVNLIQAERWNGVLPQTMPPLGTLPILNTMPAQ